MASPVTLPPGFVLEQPQAQNTNGINLPPGFVLEQPSQQSWKSLIRQPLKGMTREQLQQLTNELRNKAGRPSTYPTVTGLDKQRAFAEPKTTYQKTVNALQSQPSDPAIIQAGKGAVRGAVSLAHYPIDVMQDPTSSEEQLREQQLMEASPMPSVVDRVVNRMVFEPARQELQNAQTAAGKGQILRTIQHAAGAAVPALGPWVSGAVSGATGEYTGFADPGALTEFQAQALGAKESPRVVRPVLQKTAEVAAKAARVPANAIAPRLAETAMGIQTRDRLHGKKPGETALRETKANNPAELSAEAHDRAAELTKQLEIAADKSEMPASVDQAVAMLNEESRRAVRENNPQLLEQVNQLKNRMTMDLNGQPFPNPTTPGQVLALKRGIDDLIASWGPREKAAPIESVRHRLYGILDNELERTVPEAKVLNPVIADLITVGKRTELKAAGPDTMQKLINRAAVHTGALTSAVGGYMMGGPLGGLAGFVLPELASNPTIQMKVSRFLAGDQSTKLTPKEIGSLPPRIAVRVMSEQKARNNGGTTGEEFLKALREKQSQGASLEVRRTLMDLYRVSEPNVVSRVKRSGLEYNGIADYSEGRNGIVAVVTDPETLNTYTIPMHTVLEDAELANFVKKRRDYDRKAQYQQSLKFEEANKGK